MNTNTRLGPSQIAIIVLAIATAAIHFSRAAADPEIAVLFALNGLGYLALTAALFLLGFEKQRGIVRWIMIVYTAITVIFYGIWGAMSGEWVMPLGPIDKVIEIALILLLLREQMSARKPITNS